MSAASEPPRPHTPGLTEDVRTLQNELARVHAENAQLRASLARMPQDATAGVSPSVTHADLPAVDMRRRFMGGLLAVIFLVVAFVLGVIFAHQIGGDVMEGYRDNYDPGSGEVREPPSPADGR